jgi:formylglycine-generating enzyme
MKTLDKINTGISFAALALSISTFVWTGIFLFLPSLCFAELDPSKVTDKWSFAIGVLIVLGGIITVLSRKLPAKANIVIIIGLLILVSWLVVVIINNSFGSPKSQGPFTISSENNSGSSAASQVSKTPPPVSNEPPKMIADKGVSMVLIPGGEFEMGSLKGEGHSDEHPKHKVKVDTFYLDTHLVTFDQYDGFCEVTGKAKPKGKCGNNGRGSLPVINISWFDADAYCKWAHKRLPTEAEWERAVRGGTETVYFFGDDGTKLGRYAWFRDNSGDILNPVESKDPNAYGLYDMLGNVWEWCSDWYDENYYSKSPNRNPQGPSDGDQKVLRGGSWNYPAVYMRSANRYQDYPDLSFDYYGCRCAKSVSPGDDEANN